MSTTVPSGVRASVGAAGAVGGAVGASASPVAEACPAAVVYLAAAKNTYGTPSYRRALRRVCATWPRAVVMDAEGCGFVSRADWRLRWPFIRDGIDSLVLLAEADGSISHDAWLELRDAVATSLPCWVVTDVGALDPVTLASFRLYPTGTRSDRRWAHLGVSPGA